MVALGERSCRSSSLVGGKGSSLAALTALLQAPAQAADELQYRVPAGFCLTVAALERQLSAHAALQRAVDELVKAAAGGAADLAARCDEAGRLFAATPVCEEVADDVRAALLRLEEAGRRDGDVDASWAVRSSAVGEDSEELSAAGQNATLLGCRGAHGVLDGVRRCWASLFALQSVQYRRQHGQPVAAPMAVVVQLMVAADKAGVLFTCDPATGDPRRLLVTANYGLGEVSVCALNPVLLPDEVSDAVLVAERGVGCRGPRRGGGPAGPGRQRPRRGEARRWQAAQGHPRR